MNYRHAFHAGNHADVFKHLTLTRLIALMSRKEQPFAYLDTHAGHWFVRPQGRSGQPHRRVPGRHCPPVGRRKTCRR
jgi:23S rRNA A2030 N6-methylase RlmJ